MHSSVLGISCLTVAILAISCSNGIKVVQDYDPEMDFGKLHKFAWAERKDSGEPQSAGVSSLLDQRVRRSVEDALFTKGFVKTVPREADFLVQYYTAVEKKIRVDTNYYGYGYGRYGYRGGGYTDTTVREYEEGSLLIDFIDPQKQELIWRGTGMARIQNSMSPEDREARIRTAVEKIVGQFPPKK
jgi:hypothetical protein